MINEVEQELDRSHPDWKYLECVGEGWREPIIAPLIEYCVLAKTLPNNGGHYFRPYTKLAVKFLWDHWNFPPRWLGRWANSLRYNFINWAITRPGEKHPDIAYYGHENGIAPTILQVKEKFGTLRFYHAGGNDFFDGMVSMAEATSSRICEQCGKPGRPRSGGWILTLCDECSNERDRERGRTTV